MLTHFLESTGVAIQSGNMANAVSFADLVEKAKSIFGFFEVRAVACQTAKRQITRGTFEPKASKTKDFRR